MTVCGKCKSDESILWTCDLCNKKICQNCAKLTASEVKCMELKKGRTLRFYCAECQEQSEEDKMIDLNQKLEEVKLDIIQVVKNTTMEYQQVIEEQSVTIRKLTVKVEELYKKLDQVNKTQDELAKNITPKLAEIENKVTKDKVNSKQPNAQTYSQVVSKKSTVLIKPKASQSITTTKTELLQNVNPKNEKISIESLKNTSKGGMVVSCPTNEEADKLKDLINQRLANKYEANMVKNVLPRIRIAGITEKHENNILLDLIREQNKASIQDEDIKIINFQPYKKKAHIFQCVLQVNLVTYNKVMDIGYLFIGYDCCQVYDACEIKRCFKCCGFHHMAKNCTKNQICPRCSKNHGVKECKAEQLRCHNCATANSKQNLNLDTDHATWDHSCHIFKQKLEEFKSQIMK